MKKNERAALEDALRKTVGDLPTQEKGVPSAGVPSEKIKAIAKEIARDPSFKPD